MMAHQGRFCAWTGLATNANAIVASENIASVNARCMIFLKPQIFRSTSNIRIVEADFRMGVISLCGMQLERCRDVRNVKSLMGYQGQLTLTPYAVLGKK